VDERLGIDEPSVRRAAPSVVYTYLNAYGRRGPWAGARGYADLLNCVTGIAMRTLGDRPVESGHPLLMVDRPRWAFTDYAAGAVGAFATMLGLFQQRRTGRGALAETSLERATALEQVIYAITYDGRDVAEPTGDLMGWSPIQRLYETADGAVFVGALATQTSELLGTLGVDGVDDMEKAIAARRTQDVVDSLRSHDIGVHRAEPPGGLLAEDGVAHRMGILVQDESEASGHVVMPGPVARLSRTPLVAGALAPPFGANSDEIRRELGFD
jgi:crotonobetainyl-CoA:carnitine CoA-transferase CaiB-like acyl-CoA transferase